ncbi:hypothetical protein ADUPG1_000298, partial [Aduncisulcus paluster]
MFNTHPPKRIANEQTKKLPKGVQKIFKGKMGEAIKVLDNSVQLVDFGTDTIKGTLNTKGHIIWNAIWSPCGSYIAILSRHSIFICKSGTLERIVWKHELVKLLGGCWTAVTGSSEEISAANRQTCFVYATQLHFKYVIPTGDSNDQGVFTSICRPAVPLNIRGHVARTYIISDRTARRIDDVLQSATATIATHVAVALNPLFDCAVTTSSVRAKSRALKCVSARMTVVQDVLFSVDVRPASTTTTQQEPPSSSTVPSPSVPQPTSHRHCMYLPDHNRSGSISTLISTFADIDRRIRTHGHSEINKGLERLLTCTQCYLVGRKRKRGRKGKGNGKYRKSEKFIEHGRIAKGVQIALQKSLPVDANTASAAIGVQHPDLPSGVAPFEHIPSDTPPLIITA